MGDTMISGKTAAEISHSIRKSVENGILSHGEPLPTIRNLAKDLGINRNTVAAAYKDLSEEGLIAGKGRQGSRINLTGQQSSTTAATNRDLAGGNPDPELLPNIDNLFSGAPWVQRRYEDAPHDPALMGLLRDQWQKDGLLVDDMWLSSGTFDAIATICQSLLERGARIAVEDPCFVTTLGLIRQCGYEPVPMPVDDEGVTPQGLEDALTSGVDALIVTPRAHNPFGGSWSSGRRNALHDLVKRYPDVLLIEDDHFYMLSAFSPVSLVDEDRKNWAVIRSVSKYLGPDLRLAAVNSSKPVSRACLALNAFSSRWVSGLLQIATRNMIDSAAFDSLATKASSIYQTRRVAAVEALAAQGIPAFGRDGINIWIPLPDENVAVRRLLERGWSVRPGSIFRLRSDPGIRATVASLREEQAEEFATTLRDVLEFSHLERGA